MKKYALFVLMVFVTVSLGKAQNRNHSTYYYQKASLFEDLQVSSEDIVFLGNSITDGAEWHELFDNKHVKNRGISGDICMGVYDRLDAITKGKPSKIFLMIGINDLSRGTHPDTVVQHISFIIDKIKKDSPKTELYIQSILPVSDYYGMFKHASSCFNMIEGVNKNIKDLTIGKSVTYIDLYAHFVDPKTGKLDKNYSNDGLHLMGNAYIKWRDIVNPYLSNK